MTGGLRRRLATGANALLVAVFVVASIALSVHLVDRLSLRWDLSEDGASTLQAETLSVLARAEARGVELVITAFTSQARNQQAAQKNRMMRDFLVQLDQASPLVSARLVDFDLDRLTADRLGVDRYGTVVVEGHGDRVDLIDREIYRTVGKERSLVFHGESVIVSGIEKLLAERDRVIYTLDGHGELQAFDRGLGDLRELAAVIEGQGWRAEPLDLLAGEGVPQVPTDAAAVLVLGPRAALAPSEESALMDYLGSGGSLGFFLDRGLFFPSMLEALGLAMPEGMVLDSRWTYPHQDRPRLHYRPHPVTRELLDWGVPTVVAGAAPILVSPREGVAAAELLLTSRQGWIERGTEHPAVLTPEEDVAGPVTVGVALDVHRPHPMMRAGAGRVLVLGDLDVIGDELLAEGAGNATFVTNGVRWLARADERMSRIAPAARIRKLSMTPVQLRWIQLLVTGVMPMLAVLMGAAITLTRRNR